MRSATTSTIRSPTRRSILRFIEDNWGLGAIGDASFDAKAGSLGNLFSFGGRSHGEHGDGNDRLILDPQTGEPAGHRGH